MFANTPMLPFPTSVDRLAVSLTCHIDVDDVKLEGTVVNISFAGLGIELKADIGEINLTAPYFVVVDGLGEFDVKIRWNRGDRIGVRFSDSDSSRVRVQEYLDTMCKPLPEC